MLRSVVTCLVLALAASPSALRAESPTPEEPSSDEGFSLIEEGAKIILRSMLEDMKPTLDEMHQGLDEAVAQMVPMIRDLTAMIGDIRNYEAPEMLPNGDILIRRKPPVLPGQPGPDGEIDL